MLCKMLKDINKYYINIILINIFGRNVLVEELILTNLMRRVKKMAQMSMVSDDRGMIRLNQDLSLLAKVFNHPTKI